MRKLLELAKQGVGGEALNAERFLLRMLAQHGMSLSDIEDDAAERRRVWITYRNPEERRLLCQVIAKVLNETDTCLWKRARKKAVGIDLTAGDHAEVIMHMAALAPALTRHMDRAWKAFVYANDLFADQVSNTSSASPPPDPEEIRRLQQLIAGSECVPIRKGIAHTP